MIRITILVFLVISSYNSLAQNLVPNHSFEDVRDCYLIYGWIDSLYHWTAVSSATPAHVCVDSPIATYSYIPNNYIGYRLPKTGDGCAWVIGLMNVGNQEVREYLEVKLKQSLAIGKEYCIEFSTSLGGTSYYSINQMGMCFSTNIIKTQDPVLLNRSPQLEHNDSIQLDDSLEWTTVKGNMIADSSYEYISIGNFYPDSLCDTLPFNLIDPDTWLDFAAAYFIDDVFIYEKPSVFLGNDTSVYDTALHTIQYQVKDSSWDLLWSNGSTTNNITPDASGKYWLQVTNGICVTSDTINIEVISTGFMHSQNNQFIVAPNPARNFITIKRPSNFLGVLRIYNIDGAMVQENRVHDSMQKIDISDIHAGMYLYEYNGLFGKLIIH